jgi:peptide/nickel transport system substrate-binding protein
MIKLPFHRAALGLVVFTMILSACELPNQATPTPGDASQATASAAPTVPATVPRVLTVCLGQEPNSLYPFANLNTGARSVLSAIYDGPIDVFSNGYQPVILEDIPSVANGDAQVAPVAVKRGDQVIDSTGAPVTFDVGVTVLPSGCTEESCSVRYNGSSTIEMDQMVVTFRMLPDLLWSDGTALTAADSVYAFDLAGDPVTPGSKYMTDRTQTYEAVDDKTVQWWGKPGFIDPTYADNFWSPLPKHAWEKLPATALPQADTTTRVPLGWGPYVFTEWATGQYIRLEKNPNYFRAASDFPKFETLVFRFERDAEAGVSALIAGQCDLLDTSLRLDGQISLLTQLEENNQARLVVSTTPLIERLDFGIEQASGRRPGLFDDVRTRQGIASCLDRPKVAATVLAGLTVVPDSFVPTTHPLYNDAITKYPFDINAGIGYLQDAGWMDADRDQSTPRTALNMAGIPNGTPLILGYWTTSALQRRQVSDVLSQSLAQCGIKVNVQYYDQNDFYAQGPDGPLFGRRFDLAEYAIGVNGMQPPCSWFMTSEIPTRENNWVGVNVSGYTNPDYDDACKRAMRVLPDNPEQIDAYAQVQILFGNDLPSVPLYQRIKVGLTRKDLCNFTLDSFSLNDLWNIEEIDYGSACGG